MADDLIPLTPAAGLFSHDGAGLPPSEPGAVAASTLAPAGAEALDPPTGPAPAAPDVSEADRVAAYLAAHPDFFLRRPEVLEGLDLRHGVRAASLIERQVELLRGRASSLERQLAHTTATARANETRARHIFRLALKLTRAPSLAAAMVALREVMRQEFALEEVFVGINPGLYRRHDIEGLQPLEADGLVARAFENFLRTKLPECGPIAEQKARLLWPRAGSPPRSAAIVPLGPEKSLGMLALGSADPARFRPDQGRVFLDMAADLLTAALRARLAG